MFYRTQSFVAPCLAFAVFAAASVSEASIVINGSVDLKFVGVDPGAGLAAPLRFSSDSNGTVMANVGQMIWDAKNDSGTPALINSNDNVADSIMTFCIELGQYVSGSWQPYQKSDLALSVDPNISGKLNHKLGSYRAAALDLLADHFWDDATGTNLVNAVAFQFAVWEIVHEFAGLPTMYDLLNPPLAPTLDVSKDQGSFYVNAVPASGSDLDNAIDLANDWLMQLATLAPNGNLTLIALTNPNKQDQILQVSGRLGPLSLDAPEPLSLVVWGSLLAVGATVTRRTRLAAL